MLNIFVDAITVVQGTRKNDPETTKAEYIPLNNDSRNLMSDAVTC